MIELLDKFVDMVLQYFLLIVTILYDKRKLELL